MSKAIIVGDLHFGVRANSQEYLEFQLKWFRDELFNNIEKKGVEHLIFLGDVNDSRISLSPLIMKREREVFQELHDKFPNVEKHVILGNHDLYYKNSREVHSLEFLNDIGYKVYDEPTVVTIDDREILFLPWIVKDEVNDIELLLAENKFDCVFGHLEIQGFEMMKGIVDKDGMVTSLFDNCKKVFSGHYHIRSKKGKINYIGTPYELSHGDAYSEKGVELLDFKDLKTSYLKSKSIPRHLSFSTDDYSFDKINKKLITNNMLKVTLGANLKENEKIEFIERVNSLKPFKVIYEDQADADLKIDDVEIASSIKDVQGFLDEYLGIIDVEDENIDKSEIQELFKNYYLKTQM